MEQRKSEVDTFAKGINNLKNHGNTSTIDSWLEEKCQRGRTGACIHLIEDDETFICGKSTFTDEEKRNSPVKCEGVPDLYDFELRVRTLAHNLHPHESH